MHVFAFIDERLQWELMAHSFCSGQLLAAHMRLPTDQNLFAVLVHEMRAVIPAMVRNRVLADDSAATTAFQLRARKLFTAIQNCKTPPAVKSATRSQCVVSKRW